MPPRHPVDADVADVRERLSRVELSVETILGLLKEHVVERKENSAQIETERKARASSVHEELKAAAAVTNAALAAIQAKVEAVDARVALVEIDINNFRVGWKVLVGASSLLAAIAGTLGAIVARWYSFRY